MTRTVRPGAADESPFLVDERRKKTVGDAENVLESNFEAEGDMSVEDATDRLLETTLGIISISSTQGCINIPSAYLISYHTSRIEKRIDIPQQLI